jgi:hypothetical protein
VTVQVVGAVADTTPVDGTTEQLVPETEYVMLWLSAEPPPLPGLVNEAFAEIVELQGTLAELGENVIPCA